MDKGLFRRIAVSLLFVFCVTFSYAQHVVGNGKISGEFGFNGMYYIPDSLIGAEPVDSKVRANTYLSLMYNNGGFTVGAQYEFYSFPLIDFEKINYKGQGLTRYYFDYKHKIIQVTAGTFYEQFGNGFTLRSYEERQLGIDNSLLGARIRLTPYRGITIKGVWGIMRNNFDFDYVKRRDFVRGIDGEFAFGDIFPVISEKGFTATIGGSLVSKYEKSENDIYIDIYPGGEQAVGIIPAGKIPANVACWSTRLNFGFAALGLG